MGRALRRGGGTRVWACSLAIGLGAACAATSGLTYATGTGSVTGDGLQRLRWSQHGAEFVKAGAEFGAYRQVLLDPLSISETPENERGRLTATPRYHPTPEFLDEMRRAYQESFAGYFGRGGFAVVAAPAPGVLRISGHVVDLVLTARLNPEQDPDVNELVSSFGELTLLLDVRDSLNGEPLLRSVDREPIARDPVAGGARNSTGANLSAQREVFGHQALLLRQRLTELQQMGTTPAPPAQPVQH